MTVHFDDGTSAKGDVLVGADGIKSAGMFLPWRACLLLSCPLLNTASTPLVRQELLQKSHDELLRVVPLSAIVGQVTLSGDEMKRQLARAHSGYTLIKPELGFVNFVGLHDVSPDGLSGRFFWMVMRPDPNVDAPDHWLKTATQQQKYAHVIEVANKLPEEFREIYHLTPVEGIKQDTHIWRDLELTSLPACRVVLLGDAAHAMTPFRGEGGYHTFLDALALSKTLGRIHAAGTIRDIEAIKPLFAEYSAEMLKRGGDSVRFSRESYDEAKKKASNRQPFVVPMRPLPPKEVVLEVDPLLLPTAQAVAAA